MTIRRATPAAMVKASVLVVMRSGRFERRTVFMDGTTSVDDASTTAGLLITPNPVEERCSITSTTGTPFTGSVNVYSVTGELVRSVHASGVSQIDLDLTDLQPGAYAVRIGSVGRMIIVQ